MSDVTRLIAAAAGGDRKAAADLLPLVYDELRKLAAAAEAMRRVLVDRARDRNRLKRGGGRQRVDLDRLTGLVAASDDDLLGLDEALDRLAQDYPAAAELVKLRFFAGMTLAEAADALGLSDRTADRYWVFARTWLADALTRE